MAACEANLGQYELRDRLSADRAILAIRVLLVFSIVAYAAFYVYVSLPWPMLEDSPIMHYVNFLMAHGMRPYGDITDNNMPGAYLTEGWAMQVFGGGDLAWRIYDFFLAVALSGAMMVIARPYDWFAGFVGGGLFLVVHAAEGPRYAGEREQVIAVALMVGYAALFEAVRRGRPWLMAVFGVAGALAASIKPTFLPLWVLVMILAAMELRKRRVEMRAYVGWSVAGGAAMSAVVLGFLMSHHALAGLVYVVRVIIPSYHDVWPATMSALLTRMFPQALLPVLGVAVVLAVWRGRRWTWEQRALLVGAVVGLASYFIQRKAFLHHRYPWLAFCLLLCALEVSAGLRQVGWRRVAAGGALVFVALVCVPRYARLMQSYARTNEVVTTLEQDLTAVGGGDPARTLPGQVECFDLISGCLSALYHMQLTESSGFTGDLLFFRRNVTPTVTYYREMFWERARSHPPTVLVVTNEWFGEKDSFGKMDTWPEFAEYVRVNYRLWGAREFPQLDTKSQPGGSLEPRGYRIYVREMPGMEEGGMSANARAGGAAEGRAPLLGQAGPRTLH